MALLAGQRHERILDLLETTGGVRVAKLAVELGVTEETIRRDLEKLDQAGKLVRIHGGAVPLTGLSRDLPFDVRQGENLALKELIAKRALVNVSEGDVLAFDASSTVYELARILPDIPLTVVTNSLPVTLHLWGRTHTHVLSTGGQLDSTSRSWLGSFAEDMLDRININKFFMSSVGIDLARGLSEIDDSQSRVKRRFMDSAEEVILLADHSKFGRKSTVSLASAGEVTHVITDAGTPQPVLQELRRMGPTVEVAE